MTTKRARRRKPKGGTGITLAKSSNTRARRKAATAKLTAATNAKAAAIKKAEAAKPPVAKKAPVAAPAVAPAKAATKNAYTPKAKKK
ncbi:MAG: hypothetical protein IPG10_15550 [Flavobacteriales bacterium]|nr:hypothetical protein [Flavobacteriales bacterium]MBK7268817.1 hypothetical protein [Flavobacteriales bacterium]